MENGVNLFPGKSFILALINRVKFSKGEDNILIVSAPQNVVDSRIDFRVFKTNGVERAKS
jgi:hypothetical protein